jgi:hypothetical protein
VLPSNGRFATTLERLARQRNTHRVSFDDVRKTAPQTGRELGVDLDREGPRSRKRQGTSQDASAGTDVDNQIAGLNSGSVEELCRELLTAKKVPRPTATGSRSDGHGRPPCP